MSRPKYPVELYRRFEVLSSEQTSTEQQIAIYETGDRIYVAAFLKKSEIKKPASIRDLIEDLRTRSLIFADPSYHDAITNALDSETRIATIANHPTDWFVMILTIQFVSVETDQIVSLRQGESHDLNMYTPHIIGLEISPITQITLGIDPYKRGIYLRSLAFGSQNI